MHAYYNDNDPFCAQWLRNLIAAGAIPAGYVDERSIAEVEPGDLRGFRQCHFFAGIGGWAYALQLAGWDMDRPLWTGSCPCQPFSSAGRQGGALDERHLWPRWLRLIRECRPDAILGEQVAGAIGFGWLDRVFADLEAQNFTCGAAVLGAHSVGAPHIRQRLFWVADADAAGSDRQRRQGLSGNGHAPLGHDADGCGEAEQLAHSQIARRQQWLLDAVWLPCLDGKARRTQRGILPLASGLPTAVDGLGPISRVGALRGSGNAITPQTAALFIQAVMETIPS